MDGDGGTFFASLQIDCNLPVTKNFLDTYELVPTKGLQYTIEKLKRLNTKRPEKMSKKTSHSRAKSENFDPGNFNPRIDD